MSLFIVPADRPLYLAGPSRALGERVITNDDLIAWMGVKARASFIESRTGIRTRRWVRPDQCTSDLGKIAVDELQKTHSVKEAKTLVFATVSGDYSSPPTAPFLQNAFQLENCMSFDLGAACAGFISALQVGAAQALATGEESLVIAADIRSKYLNPADFGTAVLFGDGATAGIVSTRKGKSEFRILGAMASSDGSYGELVRVPAGGTKLHPSTNPPPELYFLEMKDGAQVFLKAVHAMTELPFQLLTALKLKPEDMNWVVPHQANLHLLKEVAKRVPAWDGKISSTIVDYGNTSGSSVGIALSHLLENPDCKPGDKILLSSAGGGGIAATAVLERI